MPEERSTETWPPPPGPQNAAPPLAETAQAAPVQAASEPITHCPSCKRKLLTQTSALCNWCGAKISDPHYQQRAAETRQQRDEAERTHLETVVQEEARYGVFGRLKRRAKQNSGGSLLP